jgi:hypothetical protein
VHSADLVVTTEVWMNDCIHLKAQFADADGCILDHRVYRIDDLLL